MESKMLMVFGCARSNVGAQQFVDIIWRDFAQFQQFKGAPNTYDIEKDKTGSKHRVVNSTNVTIDGFLKITGQIGK